MLVVAEVEHDGGLWLCMSYLSGGLAEVFIWGPRHRRLSFSSVFTRVLLLLALAAMSVFHARRGQDGPLPTPSPHIRRVARLGLRPLHIFYFYYHVDLCRHKNVAVAYAGMWRFAGSIYGGAVAEGAIRPPCLMAYVACGVAVGGFVGWGLGGAGGSQF